MSARRRVCGAALVLALAAVAAPGAGTPADDDQLLRQAQIGTDGPALLAYFRQRTVTDADRQRIDALIRQLGDPAYAVRERASAEVVACGIAAIGPLRAATADPDVEIARRAERCLQKIERVPTTALSAAAARAVARRKPAGAVGVLLNYLPAADDEGVADEVRESLAAVAVTDGKPDPLLGQTLDDPNPLKRGAAAEALARSGLPAAVELSRKALADGNADVRLRTALALVTHAKDKKAMPAMIGLLAELPQGSGWKIEDVLVRLAGEGAPKASLGADDASRQRCRDAWQEWWAKNGETVDLAKLDAAPPMLGHTLLVLRERTGGGKVVEIDAAKKELWKIEGLQMPTDAVVVGRDRVLICEQNTHQVSERDFSGKKVYWNKQIIMPTGVQRLPNGNTFVVCRNQLVELDARQQQVFSHQRNQQADIAAAEKLRSGEIVYVTTGGTCVRLDAKGKEIKSFPIGRMYYSFGGLDVLPNNHILVTQRDGVAEYDGSGGPPVWQAAFPRPTSVQRLPNGNTLVASGLSPNSAAAELDRAGHTVWEYKPPDGSMPWRARRR
ncbi:MAG TPA: HEAT repeat domain-containing protein [Gemmataceae bacterium]